MCTLCSKPTKRKTVPRLIFSKPVQEYIKISHESWLKEKTAFLRYFKTPMTCGLYFLRSSRHRFDYHNATQIIGDLMSQYGYFEDDNADIVKFIPLGYGYDKLYPGIYIINMPSYDNYVLNELTESITICNK